MDLDPMISSSQEDYSYSDYDNRPIRPMNQEALNETLAKLPILIDEDDYNNRTNGSSDSSISIKARLTNRRQPILAYSTRRKNNLQSSSTSNTNSNQSLLHVNTTIGTPKSNKRKLGGCTPTVTPSANKVIKQLDCRQELIQLKEENKLIAQAKENLQIECALLKNKKSINKSTLTNGRMPLKGTSTDRPRTAGSILPTNTNTNTKTEPNRSKTITKMLVTRGTKQDELTTIPSSSVNMTLNKSNSPTGSSTSTKKLPQFKSKIKPNVIIEDKKKSVSSVPLIEKRTSLISTRTRSKVVPMKS
ncbi:unnamed protein product [Rotaria magnacalcarata]|uniref:Uncharacterized protein n=1 Tax=Rotaria magnacalcarata TaxID=392030 RepID=A0A8S2L6G6_9BILA|nr:unnamed protein product [Rotaria magnacalcarata]